MTRLRRIYHTTEGKFVRIENESFEIHPASRNKSHPKQKKIQNTSEIESVPGDEGEEKKRKIWKKAPKNEKMMKKSEGETVRVSGIFHTRKRFQVLGFMVANFQFGLSKF